MSRLQIPLTEEGYAQANEAFRHCWSGDRWEVLNAIQAHLPTISDSHITVLGIGVGDGEFDEQFIDLIQQKAGPLFIKYTAVEPNQVQLQGFAKRLSAMPTIQLNLQSVRAEDFVFDQQFDIIHYIHSLYHVPEHEERLIRESLASLKPQGCFVAALSTEQGGIYQMMHAFWNVIDYSAFTSGLFGQESLQKLLDQNRITYDYQRFPDIYIDVTACFDMQSELGKHLLNFVLQANIQHAPTEVYQQALAKLKALAYEEHGIYKLSHGSGVFVLRREQEREVST
ncbi:MAG: methyltransferase domain-containing protein [Chloroflexi bacterium AL-W]|nr:methyltransferase domain-containing protein [Chloroflexi bacterium AL-N1]NOK68261.1 methyltransferase domain-containing protein [Chloroflexi bacterium AL-N10]NOK73907.1 methyltransferase domain-containing protein [Chloroflexi bacterium AL-N5]NOK82875.1 methyltransferase domain-containing protein [Chloroflexi bacterium AL-W]NOK90397.1 methyltransferase domain-containing protein [Chloroflexi bacterium AL-N15]